MPSGPPSDHLADPHADPFDDERLTAAGLLFEAYAGLSAALERRLADECDLSIQWFEVLIRLARSPGHRLRMCELANQVALSPSGLTRAVDRLEVAQLVTRSTVPKTAGSRTRRSPRPASRASRLRSPPTSSTSTSTS